MKTVAIVQSNYVPWKGYFDLIDLVDEFIIADDLQYTRRDWRNRNRIKTAQGTTWLTIPVNVKGRYEQRIDETEVSDSAWAERHWQTIRQSYARAAHFPDMAPAIEQTYAAVSSLELLSEVNARFIHAVCGWLSIDTPITRSTDYEPDGRRSERLLSLCLQAGADTYVSGPAARAYLDEALFADAGVSVRWMSYEGYPEYPQLHPPFEHHVSVLDLLLNTGPDAPRHLLGAPGKVGERGT